nr:synaptobrevin, longin-like domain protein [Tanacetum cinerariifolium]
IRQFWSTARIETTKEGTKILATVDGIFRTVTESSLMRNLKLQDEEGINSLPDTKLFENLSLMGYNISQNQKFTFQKGQFSHQWKYLIHTIMQCLSPKSTGFNEFSDNIATALVCLATNKTYNFSKMIFDGLVKNINNKGEGSGTPTEPHHTPSPEAQPSSHTHISSPSLPTVTTISTALIPNITPSETTPLRQYTRRAKIAQSSALPPVADELASLVRDVSQWEACPTESGFIADQDRTTIAKSSTLPHDSAARVTSPAVVEGSMQQTINELTDFCTSLQRQHSELLARFQAQEVEINKLKERVKLLEDGKGMAVEGSGDDAPIKGRRLDKEEVETERVSSDTEEIKMDEKEVAVEKVSDDTEEMATVLISMDAASVLSSRGVQVVPTAAAVAPANVSISTSSGVVPTASTTIFTATPIFATATTVTPYTRRKGKEKMVETHIPKKQKKRIHAEEELQQMIAGLDRSNETIAKHLEEYDQAAAEITIGERIELIFELVKYQDHHSKILKYQAQQRKFRTKKQKRDFYMVVIKNNLGWKVKDFNGMSFKKVEAKFKRIWEQIEGGVSKIPEGEAVWLKRKRKRSEQESAKKQKTT